MDARVKPGHDESIDRGTSLGLLSGQFRPAYFTLSPNNVHVLAESCGQKHAWGQ